MELEEKHAAHKIWNEFGTDLNRNVQALALSHVLSGSGAVESQATDTDLEDLVREILRGILLDPSSVTQRMTPLYAFICSSFSNVRGRVTPNVDASAALFSNAGYAVSPRLAAHNATYSLLALEDVHRRPLESDRIEGLAIIAEKLCAANTTPPLFLRRVLCAARCTPDFENNRPTFSRCPVDDHGVCEIVNSKELSLHFLGASACIMEKELEKMLNNLLFDSYSSNCAPPNA